MAAAGQANRSLARYDGLLDGVPNPDVLLAPIATQEATDSSKIEGTQATWSDYYRYEAGDDGVDDSRKLDIQEIHNYRKALLYGESQLIKRPFSLNLLKDLHSILLDSVRGRDKARGEFRRIQNWIGPAGAPVGDAVFVPPDPAILPELLDNWEKYYHADRPDYLVQLAIVHAQFEILHPFLDGNGRLGRMIIPLFLYEKQILHTPMFYMSGWLEAHKEEYMARLRPLGVEKGAWDKWILFFLGGLNEQALANATKTRAILELYREMKDKVIALTHSQYAVPILDDIFATPWFTASTLNLEEKFGLSRQTVSTLIRKLESGGVITCLKKKQGSRPAMYAFPAVINICEGRHSIAGNGTTNPR